MLMQAPPAPSTTRIAVVRAFSIAGEVHPVGAEIDVPNALAIELVALNKAAVVATPATKAAKPKKAAAATTDEAAP